MHHSGPARPGARAGPGPGPDAGRGAVGHRAPTRRHANIGSSSPRGRAQRRHRPRRGSKAPRSCCRPWRPGSIGARVRPAPGRGQDTHSGLRQPDPLRRRRPGGLRRRRRAGRSGPASQPWFAAWHPAKRPLVTSQAGASYAGQPAILVARRPVDERRPLRRRPGRGDRARQPAAADARPPRCPPAPRWRWPTRRAVSVDRRARGLSTGRRRPAGRGRQPCRPWCGRAWTGVGQRARVLFRAPGRRRRLCRALGAVAGRVRLGLAQPAVGPRASCCWPSFCRSWRWWFVAERGVVRWIAYLQRIAAIYARGRFSVRPVQAE